MCATKTYGSVIEIPASAIVQRNRPTFLRALTLVVDAFLEARAMQRIAQRGRLLNDE
jgi:tRNA isopentenyl-2-thiomethyl-A-37 hydroxylase MiaE